MTRAMAAKSFQIIGVGVAFSPNLKANLYEGARLALFLQAKLVLIHVGKMSKEDSALLHDLLQVHHSRGLVYEISCQTGDPVEVIISTVKKAQIDLLILGALQRENFLKYYLGSIARQITRKAPCSVLLLIKPSVERVPCEHIVVNGLADPKTGQTIETAFAIAKNLGAHKITIVEEIRPQEVAVSVDDDRSLRRSRIIKERLKLREKSRVNQIIANVPETHKEGIAIQSQSIFGKRGYSIGHYAQVVRADLLVMNSPSRMTFWDRLFPHDIEHILGELPTDVLIVQ